MQEAKSAPVRGDTSLPGHVDAAIERAHAVTQAALSYLHAPTPRTKAARRAVAAVYADQKAALTSLEALSGQVLVRTTSTGKTQALVVTRRQVGQMRAVLDGVYGLMRKWCGVAQAVDPVVPVTRLLGSEMASKALTTSTRTWTKWLPWLHVAGLVVYQPGSTNHPTLIGLPSLYLSHRSESREALQRHRVDGYGLADDHEVARRGRWWEPICTALLDEVEDVTDRCRRFAALVVEWTTRWEQAARKKFGALVDRVARRSEKRGEKHAVMRVEEVLAKRAAVLAHYEATPAKTADEATARRQVLRDLDRSLVVAQSALERLKQMNDSGQGPVRAVADFAARALQSVSSNGGGRTACNRNDPSDFFEVIRPKTEMHPSGAVVVAATPRPDATPPTIPVRLAPVTSSEAGKGRVGVPAEPTGAIVQADPADSDRWSSLRDLIAEMPAAERAKAVFARLNGGPR